VRREVEGVRDSINLGLTFWNNSGRYDDIPVMKSESKDLVKSDLIKNEQLRP
jgi:hypothetical protein